MATDSRKRTLEALERRIAFAKAEVLQKEKKNKESINEERKPLIPTDSTSKDPSPHLLHSSSVTPKKGNSFFNFVDCSYFLLSSQPVVSSNREGCFTCTCFSLVAS